MEELKFKGKIEDIAVKPTTKGTDYVKLKVSGKTFNFYDMKLYAEHKANFKIGNIIDILYFDSTWTGEDKIERTSHTMTTFSFDVEPPKPPEGMKPVADFVQATQTTQTQEDSIETIMKNCLRIAMEITDKYLDDDGNNIFSSEDVRTICNSLFMEACKRRR